MKKLIGTLVIGALLVLLISSCVGGSGFYKSHYPNALKHGKLKKTEHIVAPQDVVINTVEPNEPNEANEISLININTDSTSSALREFDNFNELETMCDQANTKEANERSMNLGAQNPVEAMVSKTNIESDDIPDEEPSPQVQTKKRINRNSLTAILLIPILFVGGILVIVALFSDAPIIAAVLLVAIGVGCVVALIKSIIGAHEIKENPTTQNGTGLSVLAGLASVFGLILTGLLFYLVLIY